jgi:aminoglycoside phosphotransferase family enzyme/predicted kinase
MNTALIKSLRNTSAFPHAVKNLKILETHISWVILTGEFAYKIKKPVDLGFVDFTSLERRKYFCEEELRLNQRMTPDLYLDVVPIAETAAGPRIGQEPAVEYAVRMRQFPHEARLDHQLELGRLYMEDMRALAEMVAGFHESLPPKRVINSAEEVTRIRRFALDNFTQIKTAFDGSTAPPDLSQIEAWTQQQLETLTPLMENRALDGFIREGHGDLHLANIARPENRLILFDCLEFNPELRWIDPINDIAFLVMDLITNGREDLAFTFLNAYLEQTGDYGGIAVLRFYLVYRCLVRAKVAAIQPGDSSDCGASRSADNSRRYLQIAKILVNHSTPPRLFITHGFSGVGKTWLGDRLIGKIPAIRIRSDVERKRLFNLAPGERSDSGVESGLYTASATDRTYQHLAGLCDIGLRARFNMIADATFLQRRHRVLFLDLADRLQVMPVILDCSAAVETLRNRIRTRATDPQHVSEADLGVLEHQLAHHDPLTADEKKLTIQVSLDQDIDFSTLIQHIASRK